MATLLTYLAVSLLPLARPGALKLEHHHPRHSQDIPVTEPNKSKKLLRKVFSTFIPILPTVMTCCGCLPRHQLDSDNPFRATLGASPPLMSRRREAHRITSAQRCKAAWLRTLFLLLQPTPHGGRRSLMRKNQHPTVTNRDFPLHAHPPQCPTSAWHPLYSVKECCTTQLLPTANRPALLRVVCRKLALCWPL